jgi:arsenic resistance protein ArsH
MKNDFSQLQNIQRDLINIPDTQTVFSAPASTHPPRILLLYGSLRDRSFSRLVVQESARILEAFGAETRIFNPSGLPLPDGAPRRSPESAGTARAGAMV